MPTSLRHRLKKTKYYPFIVEIEPLFACNLSCPGCGKIQHPTEILRQRLSVEDVARRRRGERHADGVDRRRRAAAAPRHRRAWSRSSCKRKVYVYLCTNAVLLRRRLDRFTPSHYFSWVVHMDGLRERHDAAVDRAGVFDEAVAAIREAKARGFRVTTNSTFFNTDSPKTVRDVLDFLNDDLKVDAMMISPAYAYEKAPDQEHFLGVEQTRAAVQGGLRRQAAEEVAPQPLAAVPRLPGGQGGLPVHGLGHPELLGASAGSGPATSWPTATPTSYRELVETTDWGAYGRGRDPRCANCMAHCGYEPSAVIASLGLAAPVAARAREHALIAHEPSSRSPRRVRRSSTAGLTVSASARWTAGELAVARAAGDPPVPRLERLGDRGPSRLQPRRGRAHASPCTACSRRPTTPSSGTPATRPTCTSSSPAAQHGFAGLRQRGGLSGYPNRSESEHDLVENSHASTALSYAYGLARARRLTRRHAPRRRRRRRRRADRRRRLRGAQQHRRLGRERRHRPQRQRAFLRPDGVADLLGRARPGSRPAPPARDFFEALGIAYLGPVDGHDLDALEPALRRAAEHAAGRSCCTCTRPRAAATSRPSSTRRSACTTSGPSTRRPASRSLGGAGRLSYTEAFAAGARARGGARAPSSSPSPPPWPDRRD